MNRIEPIGPRDADIPAIPAIPRRAPDRERPQEELLEERQERSESHDEGGPAPVAPPDLPNLESSGEHVDVRA